MDTFENIMELMFNEGPPGDNRAGFLIYCYEKNVKM